MNSGEVGRLRAAKDAWNSRCPGVSQTNAERQRCLQDKTKLDAWEESLKARMTALLKQLWGIN